MRRVHVLAWRDLDDPDAGGSEVHADEFMRRWAAAGLDIVHRTSAAVGLPSEDDRNGYRVIRRGSRYSVFPRTAVAELTGRMGPSDGLIEVWNGVPWFSPVWYRRPHVTVLHHVHGPMWDQIMPRPFAGAGRLLEARIAPPFYRRSETVTPSAATRQELIELGFRPERVTAVDNGVDEFFTPGGERSPVPLIVAAGRLAPVKRFELLLDAALEARATVPDLRVRIIGEGPLRTELAVWVERHRAREWVELPGHISRLELRDEYRRAWVVASGSLAEGWGLTMTEAAACATPAVATDIRGHRCSVVDGVTGVLAPPSSLGAALAMVLGDDTMRARMASAALARARTLTWDDSALGLMEVLHRVVTARSGRRAAG
ncbi:MAG: glycosyltransferase family 4 protein [Acidimicrobiia bacterium]|nr:glycosyltransferase family 4 protein [Acidimicrobiia bacterium]